MTLASKIRNYIKVNEDEGVEIPNCRTFRHLMSSEIEDVDHRLKTNYMREKKTSTPLCDNRILRRLERKYYKTIV